MSNPYFEAYQGSVDVTGQATGQTCPTGSRWSNVLSQCLTDQQFFQFAQAAKDRGDTDTYIKLMAEGSASPLAQGNQSILNLQNFLGVSALTLGVVVVGVLLVLVALYAWLSEKNIKIAGLELPNLTGKK